MMNRAASSRRPSSAAAAPMASSLRMMASMEKRGKGEALARVATSHANSIDLRRARLGERFFQVFELLAALRAELLQPCNVLARPRQVAGLDVKLAQVLERTLVIGIELQGLAVERVGGPVVAALAQAEAQKVVHVGVLHT